MSLGPKMVKMVLSTAKTKTMDSFARRGAEVGQEER